MRGPPLSTHSNTSSHHHLPRASTHPGSPMSAYDPTLCRTHHENERLSHEIYRQQRTNYLIFIKINSSGYSITSVEGFDLPIKSN